MKCLLFTKDHAWGHYAIGIARHVFDETRVFTGTRGAPFPAEALKENCDAVISFISPWIIPIALLERSPLSINFHPGNRHYPGIGCYNFALYEDAKEFGCVCHHMEPKPDTGRIIAERRFAIGQGDTVESLQLKCFAYMIGQFLEICERVEAGDRFQNTTLQWERQPFTRRQMEALRRLDPDMTAEETRRRIRAMTYPGAPGAYYLGADGQERLVAAPENRTPMAFDI